MPIAYQEHDVPEQIHALGGLTGSYYVDLFTVPASDARRTSPEEWARAALEGASPVGRFLAWRALLNLRLAPGWSPDHIAGWRIAERGEDWIRIEASSWFLTARIVFHVREGLVSMATFVRNERRITALVWPAASIIHRHAMPGLMRHAVRRIVSGPRRSISPILTRS